ncbi:MULTISPECIES: LysE family translocator [unclassified Polaromonas]|jgi:threonine/homoserine/homoserine lactone efflux protein|uniref:LysE family translocator n=1 Tax=unclassified Polaromonas TaxID=2638319 RepID=UPI000BD0EF13|nr:MULTISPECIES: LysE family translocator [unclassified Polaromonas]OYY34329.1 MAG: lysine transporter LysE [Polaromonas sp. 35-63-35]OYZ17829.1 MAG: lysine transporter LysE [Polaromonas sp. 16-63-31]OYZ77227.1 MAG: lysine transporter LysE [Polaromonas sp. 24-63-21]OZA48159.1 MAG: lysine transporter LysE [Polaromonas sp. 17-63-33]OZA86685.1 MAG: lysine transporter LysE [Polaromonas sp. 39-63-25]
MLTTQELAWFALVALALVLTPGPNMIYCISRTLCQGRAAGMVSLGGVALGFVVHLLGASFGLSALLLAAPLAFTAIKVAGALYLLWLAWQAVKPGGLSPFETRSLPHDPPRKLFLMGFMTNLLNPKVAMFYLSFFPQFLHPERGQVLLQSLSLGAVQIAVSLAINTVIIFFAAGLAVFLNRNIAWMRVQRYVMGSVLGLLALRLLSEKRTST